MDRLSNGGSTLNPSILDLVGKPCQHIVMTAGASIHLQNTRGHFSVYHKPSAQSRNQKGHSNEHIAIQLSKHRNTTIHFDVVRHWTALNIAKGGNDAKRWFRLPILFWFGGGPKQIMVPRNTKAAILYKKGATDNQWALQSSSHASNASTFHCSHQARAPPILLKASSRALARDRSRTSYFEVLHRRGLIYASRATRGR